VERPAPPKGEPAPPLPPDATCARCKVVLRSAEAGQLLTPHHGWWKELLLGASFLPRGALRVVTTPALWKFAIVPLLINICAIALSLALAYFLCDWLEKATGQHALQDWTGWLWGSLAWVVGALGLVARILAWLLMPVLAACLIVAFPFNLIYKLMFMPFMELLTEATERQTLGIQDDGSLELSRIYANLVIAAVDAVLLTGLQGLMYLVLCPLAFIPVVNFFWLILPPALFAGMDYSDINLVRRGYVLREKVRLWRTHEWRFLGYGVSFFFLLTVPGVNAFVIPSAAAGGALLYLGLDRK
jgi:uncharacterized protein involved in cysteine biosynthesis